MIGKLVRVNAIVTRKLLFRTSNLFFVAVLLQGAVANDLRLKDNASDGGFGFAVEEIRENVHSGAWRRKPWVPRNIIAWLEATVRCVADVTKEPTLKLPVQFSDVLPARQLRANQTASQRSKILVNECFVGKDFSADSIRNSIVLVDGSAYVKSATDSVIVATSTTSVIAANRCLIIAGVYAHVAFDGELGGPANGSVIISRGSARIRSAEGSSIVAPMGASVDRADGVHFINTPVPMMLDGTSQSSKAQNLPVDAFVNHPIGQKLAFVKVGESAVKKKDPRFAEEVYDTLIFEFNRQRIIASPHNVILDESGNPFMPMVGWKIEYISPSVAIIRKNEQQAIVFVRAAHP
jgi:hypothetical protein